MKTSKIITSFALVFTFTFLSCTNNVKKPTNTQTSTKPKVEQHQDHGQSSVKDKVSAMNALQTAESIKDFSTLVTAIRAAGVEDAVVNVGPLTIFAPLNSAFNKLPKGTVETLLKPENKAKLAFILINHVAPSNYPIEQLKKEAKKGRKLYMASGKYLAVERKGNDIYVGGSKIIKSVKVSNGWIHVIDNVLVPTDK